MTQEVVIDVRGQSTTQKQRNEIRQKILEKTNGILKPEDIIFRGEDK